MPGLLTLLAFILAIIYIISPYDVVPDLFPITGWLDDTAILALVFYYLRNGKLPDFLTRMFGSETRRPGASGGAGEGSRGHSAGRTQTSEKADPHAVLGIRPGASKEEVHAAYRRLAHQYHPDKVAHLGTEFQEMARKKFVEIQEAYQLLTGRRP